MMGRHHARVLRALDGVELVGVADPSGDVHGAAAGIRIVDTLEQLLEIGIDYCVVAAPTASHADAALMLAGAGVPALIEKPLAMSVASAESVVGAFTDAGVIGAVGHIERYNPALRSLRVRLDNGDLGGIHQVSTRRQGPFPSRIADVGVIKDLATHDLDLTGWVTRQRYRSVAARIAFKSGRVHEDLVAVVGQLGDGTVTNHLVNWLSPFKDRVTIVTGDKGAFVADTLTADLTFYANGDVPTTWDTVSRFRGVSEGNVTRYAIPKPEPLQVEHEAFRNAVLGRDADIVTLRDGLHAVAVAEAVFESATTDRVVPIQSVDPVDHPNEEQQS
jgi:predicted dehydrogenase